MPQLIIKWGNRETRFTITAPSVDIGRADDNLLQVKDVKVSRYHCKIVQTPLGFLLSDSESNNGTFLNGKRVERTLLHNNDAIKIGNVGMVFSESDSVRAENNGPVVISSSQTSDNASVGEVTTVINIQAESVNSISTGGQPSQNGTAQVTMTDNLSTGTVVVAQVAKRVVQNNAQPAQMVMNNQVLQNVSGRPSGTPARIVTAKPAQPARPVFPQSRPGGTPKPAPVAQKPVSRITPPAPKPQSGLISRLAKAPKPLRNNQNSAIAPPASFAGRISSAGVKSAKAGKQDVSTGSATQGPAQPKKNKNMFYIIGGVALILVVIIAFAASSGSNKKADEESQREIELLKQADKLYGENDYNEALKRYEAFLVEFHDSKNANGVKDRIRNIKERDEKEKEARPKLIGLKRKKKDYSTSQYPELLKEFDAFIKEYSDVSASILQEAKGERETVKRIVSSSGENDGNIRFNEALAEANKLRDKKNYDGALAKLKSFLKENRSLNDRQGNTIRNEIKAIENEKEEKSEKK